MTAPLARARRDEGDGGLPGLPPALRHAAISVLALLAAFGLGRFALQRFDTPVQSLVVAGPLKQVQPDEVRRALAPLLDEAGLFATDLGLLRGAVERLPWVAHARVDRVWPGQLAVRVTEREPFARWGADAALSTEGIVFAPGPVELPATLPRLDGAPGREREVMAMFGQLADLLSETPLALEGLTQDARGEWTGLAANGLNLRFGRADPATQVPRLKAAVIPALGSRLDRVATIDLRYGNGFAVAWRESATTPNPSLAVPGSNPGETP